MFAWPTTRDLQVSFPEQRTAQRLAMVGGGTFLLLIGAKLTIGYRYAAMFEHIAFAAIILLAIGFVAVLTDAAAILVDAADSRLHGHLRGPFPHRVRAATNRRTRLRPWCVGDDAIPSTLAEGGGRSCLADRPPLARRVPPVSAGSLGATAGRRSGLESMIQPLLGFGRLLQAQAEEGFELRWGSTILSYPATIVPDWLFAGGPTALGYDLVQLWSPSRYGTGYSVAATVVGESVYNFGPLFGVLITILVIAIALRLLDKALTASAARAGAGAMSLLALAVCECSPAQSATWCGVASMCF